MEVLEQIPSPREYYGGCEVCRSRHALRTEDSRHCGSLGKAERKGKPQEEAGRRGEAEISQGAGISGINENPLKDKGDNMAQTAQTKAVHEPSGVSVRVARHGDKPQANAALIAGADNHLIFTSSHSLGYTPEPRDCFYRPSIDVFFQSVVRNWRGKATDVLLTGMGRDGAKGLRTMRDAGSLTIAQDAASSVVYGMPKAAAELNAAGKILPLNEIASGLINFVTVQTQKLMDKQSV